MSAKAGWYPDPGGTANLFRYWDGKAWSAATSPNPGAPPPTQGLPGATPPTPANPYRDAGANQPTYAQGGYGSYGQSALGSGTGTAYANYQQVAKNKSPVGWWIAGAALVVVIVVVAVIAIRAVTGGQVEVGGVPGGPASQDACPAERPETPDPNEDPNDGRVHGGPISYPTLGSPWGVPRPDSRVPFGNDVLSQIVPVESNYDGKGGQWVASVLVGELQAGDGFFTPEQGSEIVVKCILGKFYGDAPVNSNVKVNEAATIDGREAWIVESQLSFDITGLKTKGELLIVVIVSAGARSGLYYASIPDTTPELVQPARDLIGQLEITE